MNALVKLKNLLIDMVVNSIHTTHKWYDTVLDWGLNPGPPSLEASTLPLGYRGGGNTGLYFITH